MEAAQRQPRRVLFHSGRIVKRRDPKPCTGGLHVGPLIDTAKFEDFEDPFWWQFGNCRECGSTIHKSQLRARAA